jgi:hypothetical protein
MMVKHELFNRINENDRLDSCAHFISPNQQKPEVTTGKKILAVFGDHVTRFSAQVVFTNSL